MLADVQGVLLGGGSKDIKPMASCDLLGSARPYQDHFRNNKLSTKFKKNIYISALIGILVRKTISGLKVTKFYFSHLLSIHFRSSGSMFHILSLQNSG